MIARREGDDDAAGIVVTQRFGFVQGHTGTMHEYIAVRFQGCPALPRRSGHTRGVTSYFRGLFGLVWPRFCGLRYQSSHHAPPTHGSVTINRGRGGHTGQRGDGACRKQKRHRRPRTHGKKSENKGQREPEYSDRSGGGGRWGKQVVLFTKRKVRSAGCLSFAPCVNDCAKGGGLMQRASLNTEWFCCGSQSCLPGAICGKVHKLVIHRVVCF